MIFLVFVGEVFLFFSFAWSERTGGREGGTEGVKGVDFVVSVFLRETFLTDLVHFPLDCSSGKPTLPWFSRETTVFLTFLTNFVPFPYLFLRKTYVTLVVVVVVLSKTDVTLVVVAVVVVVVAVIVFVILLVVIVSLTVILYDYVFLYY